MKNKKENALFIQRAIAFLIDSMIILIVATVISIPFYDNENIEKLNDSGNELAEKYVDKKIDTNTYIVEMIDINYEIAKKSGFVTIITLFLEVLYFVCYQFYKKVQTLCKKIMKIRVKDKDDNDLSMNQLIYRSMIINSVLVGMISIALVIFANKYVCFYGTVTMNLIQYLVVIISAIMIMFSRNSRGLHDIICNTKVVRDDVVKELETCES